MTPEQLIPSPEPQLPPVDLETIEALLNDGVEHIDKELEILNKWRHGKPPLDTNKIWEIIKNNLHVTPEEKKLLIKLTGIVALMDTSLSNEQIAAAAADDLVKASFSELDGYTEETLTKKLLTVINELRPTAEKIESQH